jgi:hypothetical protein
MRRSGVNSEEEYMENLTWMCENEPPEPDTEWIKNKIELLDQ